MRPQKNIKIIICIAIIVVILILLAGVAYSYFATDLFKSNKDLFFKYLYQIGDEEKGFVENSLTEYFEKKNNTPYSNEGSITVNITSDDNREQYENTNHMQLVFEGQVDPLNSKTVQDFSLNYSDDVQFPFIYKKSGDIIGIQTDYIGNKFVAMDLQSDNEIETLEGIEKLKEVEELSFSEEELKHLYDTYIGIIDQNLQETNFTKVDGENENGYQLTLTYEEFKNIIKQILETLKNDDFTLNKINEYLEVSNNSSKIQADDIDDLIEEMNQSSDFYDKEISITVYQSKGKTSHLTFKVDEVEIKIEKVVTGNDLQYGIEYQIQQDNQIAKVALIGKFAGLQSMQSISENYQLTLEIENQIYQYNYNNNTEFSEQVDITDFSEDNSLILNEYNESQVNSFLEAVMQRLTEVNKTQMEKLGLAEYENPLIYVIPNFLLSFSANKVIDNANMDELEVTTFNSRFENYESTNLQGTTVKGLLSTIELNNETQEDENKKIQEIHYDGEEYDTTEQNITFIKSSIETQSYYRVEFERDENTGLIYRAVINKK